MKTWYRRSMFGDRLFYPLAALIVAVIVGLALLPGGGEALSKEDIIAQGWQMSGPQLNGLDVSPGSNADYHAEGDGFVRLSQFTPDGEGPASIGVFATLSPDHEEAFAGQALRISFVARANPGNPLEAFEAAYFTMEGGSSGWTVFPLGLDWQNYSFDYTPPATPPSKETVDVLALFPGRDGLRKDVDLASISIEVIETVAN